MQCHPKQPYVKIAEGVGGQAIISGLKIKKILQDFGPHPKNLFWPGDNDLWPMKHDLDLLGWLRITSVVLELFAKKKKTFHIV